MQIHSKLKLPSKSWCGTVLGQKTRPTSSEVSRISDFAGLSTMFGSNRAKDSSFKGNLSRGKTVESLSVSKSKCSAPLRNKASREYIQNLSHLVNNYLITIGLLILSNNRKINNFFSSCVICSALIDREKKTEADGGQRRTREVRKQATPKFHYRFSDKRSSISRGSSGSISSGDEATIVLKCKQIDQDDDICDYIYR
jgi:hypothetical protein